MIAAVQAAALAVECWEHSPLGTTAGGYVMETYRATQDGWAFLIVTSPSAAMRSTWEADRKSFLDGTATKNGMIVHLTYEIREQILKAIWAQAQRKHDAATRDQGEG
jgi:microcystin degradation protein MlrC